MSVVCVLAKGLCPSLIGRRKGGNQNIEKKSNDSSVKFKNSIKAVAERSRSLRALTRGRPQTCDTTLSTGQLSMSYARNSWSFSFSYR